MALFGDSLMQRCEFTSRDEAARKKFTATMISCQWHHTTSSLEYLFKEILLRFFSSCARSQHAKYYGWLTARTHRGAIVVELIGLCKLKLRESFEVHILDQSAVTSGNICNSDYLLSWTVRGRSARCNKLRKKDFFMHDAGLLWYK